MATPPVLLMLLTAPSISGHVVDVRGKPMAGARVEAVEVGGMKPDTAIFGIGARKGGITDEAGAFVLRQLPPGTYCVVASRTIPERLGASPAHFKGGERLELTADAHAELTLVAAPALSSEWSIVPPGVLAPDPFSVVTLQGRAVGADGKPAGECPIAAVCTSPHCTFGSWIAMPLIVTATTAPDGTFTFNSMPEGSYAFLELEGLETNEDLPAGATRREAREDVTGIVVNVTGRPKK